MSRRGQIIRRGEGVWLIRVYRGRVDGKRQYVSQTVKGSHAEAERARTRLLGAKDEDRLPQTSRQTVAQYMGWWLANVAAPRISRRTLTDYQNDWRRYLAPALGGKRLDRLTTTDIQTVYGTMTGRGLSPRVVRKAHAALRSALNEAVRLGTLPRNPALLVTLPRMIKGEVRYLSPTDAAKFVRASQSDRWNALWLVLLFGGLRPGEAAGLRWADLDGQVLRVHRAVTFGYKGTAEVHEPKTTKGRRSVPLPEIVLGALRDHRRRQVEERLRAGPAYQDQDYMFASPLGAPVDVRSLRRSSFDRVIARAGLARMTMYSLRHTCASLLLAAGTHVKIVSERLGHSTATLTLDTYSAVLPGLQEEATARLERLVMNGAGQLEA
jgi:integrase